MPLVPSCSRLSVPNRRGASIARRGLLAASLAALIAAPSIPASAQGDAAKATSDELFRVGLESMLAGKYAEGCPKLAESLRLFPRAGTLFTLADCEAQWGHPAAAIRHYDSYLAMFAKMDPAEQEAQRAKGREKKANEQRAALAAKVGRVTLALPPGAPSGVVVKRDGEAVEAREIGAPLAVDPGNHVVTTQAPGGAVAEQKFTIGAGEEKTLELEVKGGSGSDPQSTMPEDSGDTGPQAGGPSGLRIGAYVSGGVGVAAVAAGLIMGKVVLDRSAVAEGDCKQQGDTDTFRCGPAGLEAATSGQSLATASTVTFFAGIGLLAAGAVMFMMSPSGSANASAAKPGSYAIVPMVTPVGTSGAMVGLSRAW